jgi:putative pyruvate formate lyase activating enzyme
MVGLRMATRLIHDQAVRAQRHYAHCLLCEHRCGIDRASENGRCHAGTVPRVFRHRVECGEEEILNPCHLFYLSGCDLRCVFCINQLNSFDPARGHDLTAQFFREALARGQKHRPKTLQWVGGEPTIHLPAILQAMSQIDSLPPVVWKSDFHFTPEALALLDGVVDYYVADYKFGNDHCARRLSGISNYTAILQRNLLAAAKQGHLIVRHLVMPGHFDCCYRPVAQWLTDNLPQVDVSIRGGYLPRWRAAHFPELAHPLDHSTHARALQTARQLHLKVVS